MSGETEKVVRRPFHETVVDAINRCGSDSALHAVLDLFRLIKETKIPANHCAIVAAIGNYFERIRPCSIAWAIKETQDSVLEQKKETEEEAQAKEQTKTVSY